MFSLARLVSSFHLSHLLDTLLWAFAVILYSTDTPKSNRFPCTVSVSKTRKQQEIHFFSSSWKLKVGMLWKTKRKQGCAFLFRSFLLWYFPFALYFSTKTEFHSTYPQFIHNRYFVDLAYGRIISYHVVHIFDAFPHVEIFFLLIFIIDFSTMLPYD